jgi:thioredoxin-like negative regulator of GroEL
VYAQLAARNEHAKFVKIDVDAQRELAARYRISAMPTFKFIKGGREVAEMKGANPQQLNQLVSAHAGPKPAPGAAPAAAAGGSAAPAAPAEGSLLQYVSATGLSCLGEAKEHPLSTIIGPNAGPKGRSYLESDVDPELLISVQVS